MNPFKDLEQIHADEALKQKTLQYVMLKRKHQFPKKLILACTCTFVCLVSLLLLNLPSSTPTQNKAIQVAAYVSFDVNPSMEIQVDKTYHVVKTIAFNDDAKRILKQVNMKGKSIEDAVSALVQNTNYSEYINNGFLEASVYAKDETITSTLYSMLDTTLKNNLDANQYHCAEIDQEQHSSAQSHHISGGKYRLIELIQSFDSTYDVDELNQRSVRELYEILNQFDPSIVPESCGGANGNAQGQHRGHN